MPDTLPLWILGGGAVLAWIVLVLWWLAECFGWDTGRATE